MLLRTKTLNITAEPFLLKALQLTRLFTSPATSPSAADPQTLAPHPWPEWVSFVDCLKSRGYFPQSSSSFDHADSDYRELKLLNDPCFSFARDRYDVLKSLPKADIRNIVDIGCLTLVRRVVNSAKRLREYVGLEEKIVCDVCSLRGSCDRAYLKPNDFDDPLTVDIMRLLLFYALDPMAISRTGKPASIEQVESSARRLLSMLMDLTESSTRPASMELPYKSDKVLTPAATVVSHSVETRNAEWTCPKCKFLNYSRNIQCRNCNEGVPEKRKCELKKGDWVCPQCRHLNFARRTTCHHCTAIRPPKSLYGGDWVCSRCSFLNFERNARCLKCDTCGPKEKNKIKCDADHIKEAASQVP